MTNGELEQLAVFHAILSVLDGEEVSDFFMSFWPVRRVWDLMQMEKGLAPDMSTHDKTEA